MQLFELPAGKRIAICGSTGSGKSTLALRYLKSTSYHWLIFNPKASRIFDSLGPAKFDRIEERRVWNSLERNKFTSLHFPPQWRAQMQDEFLLRTLERYTDIGICIDELYHIHNNGSAGPGVTGLLTRGRELRQSFLGLTQRPVFVSKFVFSEADIIVEMKLRFEDDRKRIEEFTGSEAALRKMSGHDFLYFDLDSDKTTWYRQR